MPKITVPAKGRKVESAVSQHTGTPSPSPVLLAPLPGLRNVEPPVGGRALNAF